MKITWVSNYRCPIWKSSNRTPVIGHPRDRAPITWQIGTQRANHDREFCYRYDYSLNWTPLGPIAITKPHSIWVLSTTIRVITVVKMLWTHEAQPSESEWLTKSDDQEAGVRFVNHAKPHSICFLPQYQRNEIFVLTIEKTTRIWKCTRCIMQMSCFVRIRLFFQNFCKLA